MGYPNCCLVHGMDPKPLTALDWNNLGMLLNTLMEVGPGIAGAYQGLCDW